MCIIILDCIFNILKFVFKYFGSVAKNWFVFSNKLYKQEKITEKIYIFHFIVDILIIFSTS